MTLPHNSTPLPYLYRIKNNKDMAAKTMTYHDYYTASPSTKMKFCTFAPIFNC